MKYKILFNCLIFSCKISDLNKFSDFILLFRLFLTEFYENKI